MNRIEPSDIERLKERIIAIIEHIESKAQRRKDTLRDILSVGEIKLCMEFISDFIADYDIDLDPPYQQEFVECCQLLGVDEKYYLRLL